MCLLHQLTLAKLSHNTSRQSIIPKPVTSGAVSPPTHHRNSTTAAHGIPLNLSFVVKVEEIRPNGIHHDRSSDHPQGFFLPPNRRDGYDSGRSILLRFHHGVFNILMSAKYSALEKYSATTVFSQASSTDHLLMVPFDARIRDVASYSCDWRSLSFYHKMGSSSSTYASLQCLGDQDGLPAPVPLSWNQLIPRPYRFPTLDFDGKSVLPTTSLAGLGGDLPLLIALIAFSAVPSRLSTVLEHHVSKGTWRSHIYDTGRQFLCLLCQNIKLTSAGVPKRGLVVTVYLDPSNPSGSTKEELGRLERGDYGPFIKP